MQVSAQAVENIAMKHGAHAKDVADAVAQIVDGLGVPAHVALAALDAMEMLPKWPLFEATPIEPPAT